MPAKFPPALRKIMYNQDFRWISVVLFVVERVQMPVLARLAAILFVFFALADPAFAQTRRSADTSRSQSAAEAELRDRINAWTVGLAGGLLEGRADPFCDRNSAGRE
jgi:hypothetical protein